VNSTLKALQPLIGRWAMELSNASFLPDPDAIIRGSFEWAEGGDFLVMRQGVNDGTNWEHDFDITYRRIQVI
jgi:hypothetical protein